mmetsp:Transcript_53251/g.122378  ORF Transcript_53251/g.122378 Transcript_53251/m.122378 type:complete len:213 (-) Transcript_53251:1165-1803(-)
MSQRTRAEPRKCPAESVVRAHCGRRMRVEMFCSSCRASSLSAEPARAPLEPISIARKRASSAQCRNSGVSVTCLSQLSRPCCRCMANSAERLRLPRGGNCGKRAFFPFPPPPWPVRVSARRMSESRSSQKLRKRRCTSRATPSEPSARTVWLRMRNSMWTPLLLWSGTHWCPITDDRIPIAPPSPSPPSPSPPSPSPARSITSRAEARYVSS